MEMWFNHDDYSVSGGNLFRSKRNAGNVYPTMDIKFQATQGKIEIRTQ